MGQLVTTDPLVLTPLEPKQLTPYEMAMKLFDRTDNPRDAIDVARELFKLQLEMDKVKAEAEFNEALTRCQAEIGVIANDSKGQKKDYASYKALDRVVRPVYLRNGLNVSFGSGASPIQNHITVTCDISLRSYTRHYEIPMDASGLGPKGDGALSKPHAILAAAEYGRRILLKMIFNIVTGEEDQVSNGELVAAVEDIEKSRTMDVLTQNYKAGYIKFQDSPDAIKALVAAKIKKQKELQRDNTAR